MKCSHVSSSPLIELVKTPGRKKAVARKPKLMSSKLAINVFAEVGKPQLSFHHSLILSPLGKTRRGEYSS